MNKEELIKEYQKIVLETNGGNDDYVVALCKIANAINELDDQSQKMKQQELEIERLNEQVSNLVNITGHYYREEITILQKALEMACDELDVAVDMLKECKADDWAYTLNSSPDYFRARAKEELKSE